MNFKEFLKLLNKDKMLIISHDFDFGPHGDFDFFCDEDPQLSQQAVDVPCTPSHERLRDFVSLSWKNIVDSGVPVFKSEPIADSNFVVGAAWERFIRNRFAVESMIEQPLVEVDSGISTLPSEPLADGSNVDNAIKKKVRRPKPRDEPKKKEKPNVPKTIESVIVCSIFAAPIAPSNYPKKMPRLKRNTQFKKVATFGHL